MNVQPIKTINKEAKNRVHSLDCARHLELNGENEGAFSEFRAFPGARRCQWLCGWQYTTPTTTSLRLERLA